MKKFSLLLISMFLAANIYAEEGAEEMVEETTEAVEEMAEETKE